MIAIITGDIIQSAKFHPMVWMEPLKTFFKKQKISSRNWAIYRGDEIQFAIPKHKDALRFAFQTKAILKSISPSIDIRMAIGLGNPTYNARNISESTGPGHIRSGRLLDALKKSKNTMAISSDDQEFDQVINIMLQLASVITDSWTVADAQLMQILLDKNNTSNQTQIAYSLGIKQSGVSRRKARAGYDHIDTLIRFYEDTVSQYKIIDGPYFIAAEP